MQTQLKQKKMDEKKKTLRLSGSSDLPAYPGFMVMQTKQEGLREMVVPSNTKDER